MCFRWVFIHEKAYQIRDTAIESSVMTKVKGFGIYNDKVMDVADYVTPTQVRMGVVRGGAAGDRRRSCCSALCLFVPGSFSLLHYHQDDHDREPSAGILPRGERQMLPRGECVFQSWRAGAVFHFNMFLYCG